MNLRHTAPLGSTALALAIAGIWLLEPSREPASAPHATPADVAFAWADSAHRSGDSQLAEIYGELPLSFEQNLGQADEQVKFISRGDRYTLFLTATDAVLALTSPSPGGSSRLPDPARGQPPQRATSTVLRMTLAGANPAPEVTGLDELQGKSHYYIGRDPASWRTGVATY